MTKQEYLLKWNIHINKLEKLTADHAAGMNTSAFEAMREELQIYAKVSWDVAVAKSVEPRLP